MSTQSIAGYNGVFSVSPDGGTTWTAVGELQDVTLKLATKMLDATSHASAGNEEYTPGNTNWTATVQALAIFADVAQAAITAALTPKTKLYFRFDPAGTATGKPRRQGYGYIEDWEEKEPNAELETVNLTIRGTGILAFSTQ
jgi:predicted secreted protein